MPLIYLVDENLRGLLWRHIRRHNAGGVFPLDALRVGDPSDLTLGSDDPSILRWAEREGRILISHDERTLPVHLADHLAQGRRSPGIFLTRQVALAEIVEFLVCAAYASEASEWENQVTFIP
jgi:Domain of unknown function (DUF5615)